MNVFWPVSTTVVMLTSLLGPAHAADTAKEVEGWTIVTRTESAQKVEPLCILLSPAAEARLQLVNALPAENTEKSIRGAARFDLLLIEALSQEPSAPVSDLAVAIDGEQRWQATDAYWQKTGDNAGFVSAFVAPEINAVLPPLGEGKELTLDITLKDQPPRTFKIALAGSGKALQAYEECLARVSVSD